MPGARGKSPSKAAGSNKAEAGDDNNIINNNNNDNNANGNKKKEKKEASVPVSSQKLITGEQLAAHNKDAASHWVCIEGKVYDVTPYLNDHPGGPEIIKENSGMDATKNFLDIGHSKAANAKLEALYIGDLDGYVPNSDGYTSSSSGSGGGIPPFMVILIVAIIALVYFKGINGKSISELLAATDSSSSTAQSSSIGQNAL